VDDPGAMENVSSWLRASERGVAVDAAAAARCARTSAAHRAIVL
jgi:hypothetical protein